MKQSKLFNMKMKQKYSLVFFTDITTNISNYCLLNIKSYKNKKKKSKKLIYVDPAVYELTKRPEYSKIDFMHNLMKKNLLLENEYLSIDYPCDMNLEYIDLFIKKSRDNNFKYRSNLKYICTIQFKFKDYKSFVKEAERLREIWEIPNKIIGIGNTCRIMHPNSFINNLFRYIRNNMQEHKIHFYGLSLRVIKSSHFKSLLYSDFKISVDSTKWTRAVNLKLKKKHGVNSGKDNRDIFFLEYMKEIKKSGIDVEY